MFVMLGTTQVPSKPNLASSDVVPGGDAVSIQLEGSLDRFRTAETKGGLD